MLKLSKILLRGKYSVAISPVTDVHVLRWWRLEYFSVSSDSGRFTVSYLINSCGFSRELALSVSKRVSFRSSEMPDRVLAFLQDNGFSKSQILKLVRRYPRVLMCKLDRTLLPKFEFFQAKGLTSAEIAEIFVQDAGIINRSMEKCIIPAFYLLRSRLLSDEKTIVTIKRFPRIIVRYQDQVRRTIRVLHNIGVPDTKIAALLHLRPRIFCLSSKRLLGALNEVRKLGFNPSKSTFILAVVTKIGLSKSSWQRKIDTYKKWGWYEKDVLAAFKSSPSCMALSEGKIMSSMNFVVKELGWNVEKISRNPVILNLSLQKRIIPRASVMRILLQKGLDKKSFSMINPYLIAEDLFLRRYVYSYPGEAPILVKIYKETMASGIQHCEISAS